MFFRQHIPSICILLLPPLLGLTGLNCNREYLGIDLDTGMDVVGGVTLHSA